VEEINQLIARRTSTTPTSQRMKLEKPQEKSVPDNGEKGILKNKSFMRYFRFGLIDNGLLVLSLIAGLSLDNFIASRIGVRQ
jgi:hypothetical protein